MGVVVNNCNISEFAKNIINGSITGTQDIFNSKSFLQSYINRIGCPSVKEVFCVDSDLPVCDNTKKKGCKFFISKLLKAGTDTTLDVSAVLSSTTETPYTYKWTWDTTKATLKTGSLDTDSILMLEYVGGSAPANIYVSVQCIDKNGCIANYSELLSACIECTNKSISVTSPANICKDANITTIDGEEYFKVEMTAAVLCNNDPAYISKLSKTALDIVGSQNDYPNGFTYSGGKFYFAIKKADIALLETQEFRFRIQVKDCVYSWLEYTTAPGALSCCHKCANVTVSATNNTTCNEKVIVNNIEYYKFIIDVDLKCGIEDISAYISKIELDNNPNVEYYFESTSAPGIYNLFVKSEDFELMCNYTPPPVQNGRITITDGIASGLYTDLNSAIAQIQLFSNATITDTSLVGDVFKFTVPAGSDFSVNGGGFLNAVSASISDPDGRIIKFRERAFENNSGNNLLGNVEYGNNAYTGASGENTLGNIILSFPSDNFADTYTGIMNITGDIGTTEGADYSNFFLGAGSATINALISKQTSNAGSIEGDLATAQSNGANINFTI